MQGIQPTAGFDQYPQDSHYWAILHGELDKINALLTSLTAERIGEGLVGFDELALASTPHSEWFNNHKIQWLLNIWYPDASFEAALKGFMLLNEKVEFLRIRLFNFNPQDPQECSTESKQLFERMHHGISGIIVGCAKKGLDQLAANYAKACKVEKGASLKQLGEKVFRGLGRLEEQLAIKLLRQISGVVKFEWMIGISRCVIKLAAKYRRYSAQLREVSWNAENGILLPGELLIDCAEDFRVANNDKQKRRELRMGVNCAEIPVKARNISTQGGESCWSPLRFIREGEKCVIKKGEGVVGTCERDGLGVAHLCNFYFKIDPLTSHLMISTGAVDSPSKASEFIEGIVNIQSGTTPFANGRWMFHTVYSSDEQEVRFGGVHSHVSHIQQSLRLKWNRNDIFILQFHTRFNDESILNPRSLRNAIHESLAFLAGYVLTDSVQLLKKQLDHPFLPNVDGSFLNEPCSLVCSLAREIRKIKDQILSDKASELFEELLALEIQISILTEEENNDSDETAKTLAALKEKCKAIEKEIPAGIIQLKQELYQKQSALQLALQKMAEQLGVAIEMCEQIPTGKNSASIEQAKLLFKVMHQVLSSQLKIPGTKALSRCAQMECLLLLYRMLDIKVVMISKSGLDDAGVAAAMDDTQSLLERRFHGKCGQLKQDPFPIIERFKARNKLFKLILNMDQNRDRIFHLSLPASSGNLLSGENARMELIERIKKDYFDERVILTYTLFYLELFTAHLITSEGEKAMNSSGVPGSKSKKIRSGQDLDFLRRVAPYVYSDEQSIELFDLGGLTSIGSAIIHRSSSSRKH